ncbi:MAG: electron transfer flavoprotein subunit beta/FixA family protein, partial [Victivallales bacterium]|nr:electron transfer flavoprotein subunit beta/FixA family protein [Victivallales bacterium]
MKILVLTKQVPESQATRMDEKTGTLIREAASSVINPLDLHALECALTLKETLQDDVDVTCLSMGPAAATAVLREALSMGADHGVLLSGREFAGSDTWCTGYALALAAKKIGPFDLIICGERATDGETGQTGPAMATFLELPAVTFVSAVERCDGGWRVRRMLEEGYETVEIDGAALLCVLKEASIPRLPTLQGKRRARGMDIVTLTAEDVGASKEDVG